LIQNVPFHPPLLVSSTSISVLPLSKSTPSNTSMNI
jgi:hypothetical protein